MVFRRSALPLVEIGANVITFGAGREPMAAEVRNFAVGEDSQGLVNAVHIGRRSRPDTL